MDDPNSHKYWVINKKAYDLTKFLDKHPGGKYILELNKGRDCTEMFYSYHMASGMKLRVFEGMLKEYYVRDAYPNEIETKFNWDSPDLYIDFKERIANYFKGKSIKANTYGWTIYGIMIVLTLISIYLWIQGYWISLLLIPFCGAYLSSSILHDATHYAMVKSPIWNERLSYLGLYHCLPLTWYHQHVIGHHTQTNIQGRDPDLEHFRVNQMKFGWRTNVKQQHQNYYLKWRNYFPLFAIMASYGPIIYRSVDCLISGTYLNRVKFQFTSKREVIEFLLELSLFIFGPWFMISKLGWVKGLIFIAVPRFIHGVGYYFMSQVSHIQEDAFKFIDDKNVNPNNEWVVHQICTSVDYETQSLFWSFVSVGLNNQAIHHICPTVHPCHYPELNKVLIKFCQDHNLPYQNKGSYVKMVKDHLHYIAKINDSVE